MLKTNNKFTSTTTHQNPPITKPCNIKNITPPQVNDRRLAYAFYATAKNYLCAALILAHQLRHEFETPKEIDIMILIFPELEELLDKDQFQQNNFKYKIIEPLPGPNVTHSNYLDVMVKLRIFQLFEYDRIIYLDTDVTLFRNIDHLFLLPSVSIAGARAWWVPQPFITTFLLVFEPSRVVWQRIWKYFESGIPFADHFYDMDLINKEFGTELLVLPSIYGMIDLLWESPNRYGKNNKYIPHMGLSMSEINEKKFVIHFSYTGKPWQYTLRQVRSMKSYHPLVVKFHEDWHEKEKVYCHWSLAEYIEA